MTREEASRGLYLMCVAAGRGERNWLIYPDRLESIKVALKALKEEPRNNPITNADKIRQMSDEELAEFFAKQEYRKPTFDGWLPLCNHVMGDRICHKNGCRECWIDWLKQEVEQ